MKTQSTSIWSRAKSILLGWLHCFGRRRSSREIDRAVRDSGRRMANLTQAERKQLWNEGMDIIYPNGWWVCACGDRVGYQAAKGKPCQMCKRSETPTTKSEPAKTQ